MKITLINPAGCWSGSVNVGLAYLSASLRKNGHEVTVYDLNHATSLSAALEKHLVENSPDLAGVSIKSPTYGAAVEVIRTIRRLSPTARIIAGGPHVTIDPAAVLADNPDIDFALAGEAEESLPLLLKAIQDGNAFRDIPGLAFREDGSVRVSPPAWPNDLDALPFPDYTGFVGLDRASILHPLVTSRGCPYRCTFCSVPLISGRKWRAASPARVLDEMSHFAAQGIRLFDIWDDNFSLDTERAIAICHGIVERGLSIGFQCVNGLRADRMTDELARAMKAAGCRAVYFGIETGDPALFRTIEKGETLDDIRRAVGYFRALDIPVGAHFIIGLPGDSLGAVKRSIGFARQLGLTHAFFNQLVPNPGTAVRQSVEAKGIFLGDLTDGIPCMGGDWRDVVFTCAMPDFPIDQMREAHRLAAEAFPTGPSITATDFRRRVKSSFEWFKRRFEASPPETSLRTWSPGAFDRSGEPADAGQLPLVAVKKLLVSGKPGARGTLIFPVGSLGAEGSAHRPVMLSFVLDATGRCEIPFPPVSDPHRVISAIEMRFFEPVDAGDWRVEARG